MFTGGFGQNKGANTSGYLNFNSNKSKTEHSSSNKGGFLLNYVDDDSSIEKLKSIFDIDDIQDTDTDKNSNRIENKQSVNLINNKSEEKKINNTIYSNKHGDSTPLDLLSNSYFQSNSMNKFQPNVPRESVFFSGTHGIPHSGQEPLEFHQQNVSQNEQEKQIEDLKKQMERQQQQIQFLLQQQQLNSFQPILNNPIPLNNTVNNLNSIEPMNINEVIHSNKNVNSIISNDQKLQEKQFQHIIPDNPFHIDSNHDKAEPKTLDSKKITTFDFSRGDMPSFSVKFNFGTGEQFVSKTKPTKSFSMYDFDNFNFSKSKNDSANKKGGNDYTDSFLLKQQHDVNKNSKNEKIILQISNIKLYILNTNDKKKNYFTYVGPGRVSITVINEVRRIIVRNSYMDRCILNTRIFPNLNPILKEKYIQIVGQNMGLTIGDNDDEIDDNVDKEIGKKEKESILSIYRICFPNHEKAKEFYQCVSLIK